MKQLFDLRSLLVRSTFVMLVASAVVMGCSDDDDNTPADPETAIVLAENPTLGQYLTDADGNTLYYFSTDAAGSNTCSGGCATNWPVYYAGALTAETLGEGLDIDDFGTIDARGAQQTTYKGWPLYYYAPGGAREASGQVTGEGVGGVWFVAKPDYTIMVVRSQLIGADGKHYTSAYEEGEGSTTYFADAEGRTLYTFQYDANNTNNYTNEDAAHNAVWPIYEVTPDRIPSTLDKTLFGSITVFGKQQLTYKGWPVYYFGQDTKRGDNKGVSVPSPGVWPVVVADAPEAPLE